MPRATVSPTKTTLRLPEDLARWVSIAAASKRQSAHAWMLDALQGAVLRQATRDAALAGVLDGAAKK